MDLATSRIIAVETSGRRGSVAVAEGKRRLAEECFPTDRDHARELIPAVDRACRAAGWSPRDLQHCYLSIGPGSFTGLRVAVTFARHLSLAVGARICAVPTLDVIAENVHPVRDGVARLAVVLDAKRGQVFGGIYEPRPDGAGRPFWRRVAGPRLVTPAELLAAVPAVVVIGEGAEYHRAAIETAGAAIASEQWWWPTAACVHELGMGLAAEGRFTPLRDLVPFYLRRPEAEELWEKRHGPTAES